LAINGRIAQFLETKINHFDILFDIFQDIWNIIIANGQNGAEWN